MDAAIALFSGEKTGEQAREIWLVDKAPVVIQKAGDRRAEARRLHEVPGPRLHALRRGESKRRLRQGRLHHPLQGSPAAQDPARPIHRPGTRGKKAIEQALPEETLRGFKGQYLETAKRLKEQQGKTGGKDDPTDDPVDQIDFEFVLFASAVIDYDYIMGLIAKFSEKGPGKSKMTREELIGLISADANLMNERDDIAEYIGTLQAGEGLSETAIRDGYTRFQAERSARELATISTRHGLATAALQTFVDGILDRYIFDGEHLSDLMAPLDLGWKARTQAELALMADLHPLLTKRAGGRDISGLSAYEQ